MSATIHDFAAAKRAVESRQLRFPVFASTCKPVSKRRAKAACKRDAVRQHGKEWL